MLTAKELATRLDGRSYRAEITKDEERLAREAGLVVVFGYSDDAVELSGAIDHVELSGAIEDEVSAYKGTTVYLDGPKVLENDCDDERCPHYLRARKRAARFRAVWCKSPTDAAWTFDVPWPHETFRVVDKGEVFCEGVVFALADVSAAPKAEGKGGE